MVNYLRPSNKDGARHVWAILSLLTKRLRQEWPKVKIIFRGDGGFCRHHMLEWCERNEVGYIVGLPRNNRLKEQVKTELNIAEEIFDRSGERIRFFESIRYAANSWKHQRRVIAKIEHTAKAAIPASL